MLKKNSTGFGLGLGLMITALVYLIYLGIHSVLLPALSGTSIMSNYGFSFLVTTLFSKAMFPLLSIVGNLLTMRYYNDYKAYLTTRGLTIMVLILMILALLFIFEKDLGLHISI